ncbi:SLAP domain-containing protein [Companilactobacillus halodurans]|uniref:S-layer protein C-terminal domain-containing protein n=1 Tax=Companilactobacillus halodurans TaxID=2584183 RepID=A0A5P0ZWL5_9LACO|nr:SLAP domain-containing protein [Companilactobacillus halodurans]MQS75341.1 hypothetical protein [Companilactobacillus halodurans]MQS97419.1 hypothetical protein [Companilactobacillus halodurans]
MKRNFKYFSSAIALTLLAIAPVAVPIVTSDTGAISVQAADSQTQQRLDADDKSNMDSDPNVPGSSEYMISKFMDQFDNRYVASTKSLTTVLQDIANNTDHAFGGTTGAGYPYFSKTKPQHIYDMQNDVGVSALKDSNIVEKNGTGRTYFKDSSNQKQYYNNDVFAYMSIEYQKNGKWTPATLDSENDIEKFIYQLDGENKNNIDVSGLQSGSISFPLRVTMHVVASDGSENAPDLKNVDAKYLTKSFTINPSTMDITEDKNPNSIHVGDKLSTITKNDKLAVTDNYSNDSDIVNNYLDKMETPHYGGIFTTQKDAISYAKSNNFDPTNLSKGNINSNELKINSDGTDATIEKPGTYYQVVSYKLSDGYSNTGDKVKDENGNDTNSYQLNGDQAIGYMFSKNGHDPLTDTQILLYDTTINGSPATEGTDYVFNKNAETLTTVRKIVVTGSDTPSDPITPVSINVDSSDKNKKLDVSKDVLKNVNDEIAAAPTQSDYYDSNPLSNADAKKVTDALDNPGSYYRELKYTLNDGYSVYNYDFGQNAKVDYDANTVTYYQKVTVLPDSSSNSSTASNWKTSDVNDVVRTKNDQPKYTLNNDDDQVINNPMIDANTSLKVDKVRVDQYGNKQYHIADGEWINANYVTLESSITDVKNDDGVLYVDKTSSDYRLYDNNGNEINNRALDRNTYWAVDEIANDNKGNTYYRVGTNEWVKQVDGVHYPIPLFLHDIQMNRGILHLDDTNQNYTLFNENGRRINNRALAENTDWKVDKTAKDYEGNTYYRVATNEWVEQRNGVHYPAR